MKTSHSDPSPSLYLLVVLLRAHPDPSTQPAPQSECHPYHLSRINWLYSITVNARRAVFAPNRLLDCIEAPIIPLTCFNVLKGLLTMLQGA